MTTVVTPCADEGTHAVLPRDLAVVVGVDVDEPGRDDHVPRVDLVAVPGPQTLPDRGDSPAGDRHVGFERLGAGPVDDQAAPHHNVEISGHGVISLTVRYIGNRSRRGRYTPHCN